MKHMFFTLLSCILLICVTFSVAHAQSELSPQNYKNSKPVFNPQAARNVASNIMPILPNDVLEAAPLDRISKSTVNKIYDQCISKVPPRFTPDAHQYYCTCSAAATEATIKMSELKELQNRKNWKLGNKPFEKYVHEVVMPCIDMPVDDMEYVSCVSYRGNDWRVSRVPQYCQCVSKLMKKHVIEMGESEMMIEWGDQTKFYLSPLDALWNSGTYNRYKKQYSEQCLGSYMKKDYLGRQ